MHRKWMLKHSFDLHRYHFLQQKLANIQNILEDTERKRYA